MRLSDQDEIYDSFEQYRHNYDIYEDIKSKVGGDLYNSFPNGVIPENTKDRHLFVMDCLRIKKYLTIFDDKLHCQNKNCCSYINYMLNKTVRTYEKPHEYIFEYYISYINHDSNNKLKNLCESKINHIKEDKYKKTDKLYSIYYLYNLFISNKRGEPLCYRAKSSANTYDNIKTIYTNLDDAAFCKALKDFKNVFEANVDITTGKCHSETPKKLSYPDSCDNLLEESIKITPSSRQELRGLEAQEKPGGQSYPQAGNHMGQILDESITSPSTLDSTLPITLFSSGVSALLILLSFYKFTPLGQFLKNRIQKFKGITKKMDEEEYEMHQHSSKYHYENLEYNGYNIAYNSS
ncbi:PIR protein [Plasmodium ovale]|uniref:PIR protein n=1 Tax=Plasmodium ovale TaxID=36330 RepID=A0A1D3JEH1_PLAOA|nr:PIR protein [Plasmodium ovale]